MTHLALAHESASSGDADTISGRRTFLRQLASLPLIGGSIALIGQPSAAAEPKTQHLLLSYKSWLHFEHRMVSYELADYDVRRADLIESYHSANNPGFDWHFQWNTPGARGPAGWHDAPQPSSRAALVLSAVGCDWHSYDRTSKKGHY